jgi:hypothetical protein
MAHLDLRLLLHLLLLLPLEAHALASPPHPANFSSLTLVGERWENGAWSALDASGHEIAGPALKRGDPGAVLISSPTESPDLLRLSADTVLCSANDTVMLALPLDVKVIQTTLYSVFYL